MGRAEDLFERLVEKGEDAVEEFFINRQSEELFLDFKRSADEGKGRKVHENDLNNLSRATSGFGNSEGGVIIWGVDCNDKSKSNTGDFPQSRKYVEDPQRFRSRLEGAVSGRTVPPHPGVRHHAIVASTGDNEGYVVTYVPKSSLRPHQATSTSQYYIRVGSEFVLIPHGILAGMFGQYPQPTVELAVSDLQANFRRKGSEIPEASMLAFGPGGSNRPAQTMPHDAMSGSIALGLKSYGPGLARDLYVTIEYHSPGDKSRLRVVDTPTFKSNWTIQGSTGTASVVSNDSYKLAPASLVYPAALNFSFVLPFTSDLAYTITYGFQGSPVQTAPVAVDWRLMLERWQLLKDGALEAKQFAYAALGIEQLGASYREKSP